MRIHRLTPMSGIHVLREVHTVLVEAHVTRVGAERLEATAEAERTTRTFGRRYADHSSSVAKVASELYTSGPRATSRATHLELSEWNHITYSWFWELKMTVSGELKQPRYGSRGSPLGRSTMLFDEMFVPEIGVRALVWRVQETRSEDE
jgi:hypothetical protein